MTGDHTMEGWAPTFTPTMEEFKDFTKYVTSIQPLCPDGICKIVPPEDWKPAFHHSDVNEVCIPHPIKQQVDGDKGMYQLLLMESKAMSVADFQKAAENNRPPRVNTEDYYEMERLFWKTVRFNPPIYGADMEGSLAPEGLAEWNMNDLGSILGALGEATLPGITSPYLYFGMWKAMFAWHVEDMNLFSINYLHFGEPKAWYGVAPANGPRLERYAQNYFPELHRSCPEFIRHKTTLISPSNLAANSIPFVRALQKAGEFVITFPYAYHCGFNFGFNCAESVNFALDSWIEQGKKAQPCKCRDDTLRIDMDLFQIAYEEWKLKPREEKQIVPIRAQKYADYKLVMDAQKENRKKRTMAFASDESSDPSYGERPPLKSPSKQQKVSKIATPSEEATLKEAQVDPLLIPSKQDRDALAIKLSWTGREIYSWYRKHISQTKKMHQHPPRTSMQKLTIIRIPRELLSKLESPSKDFGDCPVPDISPRNLAGEWEKADVDVVSTSGSTTGTTYFHESTEEQTSKDAPSKEESIECNNLECTNL
eukprot:TRINITY_DN5478_c0_g3_i1.p1 TRINITY_DN5478_c0_g3~~TRINITY_DN5478_c0_g3_i1.p1  ORF type:complete len:538 (+),score=94.50 TRINITY_DN5478_c0_g3_i1:69-1682(+)